jgi:hypothetical protein
MAKRKRRRRRGAKQRRFDVPRVGGAGGRTAPSGREASFPEHLIKQHVLISGKIGEVMDLHASLASGEVSQGDFKTLMAGFQKQVMGDQRTEPINPLGHLEILGLISEEQRKAGERFAAIDRWLSSCLAIPKRTAKVSSIEGVGGKEIREIDEGKEAESEARARAAWQDALKALMNARAASAVIKVVIECQHPAWYRPEGDCPMTRERAALIRGLDALAVHFRIKA